MTLDHVQHGVVLGGRADGTPGATTQRAGDGGVVTLGAAAREHHLARPAADRGGDLVAGVVDGAAGVAGDRACDPDGLAKRDVRNGSIASTAAGRMGVVAAWSRYTVSVVTDLRLRPLRRGRSGSRRRVAGAHWRDDDERHAGLPPDVVRRRVRRRVRRLVPGGRRHGRGGGVPRRPGNGGGRAAGAVLELAVGTGRCAARRRRCRRATR